MKTKDLVSLEQAYLKILKEDSEMDFLAQQDPREVDLSKDEETLNLNSEYKNVIDDIVSKYINNIQLFLIQNEEKYSEYSDKPMALDILIGLVNGFTPLIHRMKKNI